jgi:hypothetical protein
VVFTEPDINAVQCLQEAFTFSQESRGMMKWDNTEDIVKKYKVYWHLNKNICYEIQLLKTPQKYLLNKVAITTWSKNISLLKLQITFDYMKKCNRLQLITITITITPCLTHSISGDRHLLHR